jgi:hypothetical protein
MLDRWNMGIGAGVCAAAGTATGQLASRSVDVGIVNLSTGGMP